MQGSKQFLSLVNMFVRLSHQHFGRQNKNVVGHHHLYNDDTICSNQFDVVNATFHSNNVSDFFEEDFTPPQD